jgi:hypothetical protein
MGHRGAATFGKINTYKGAWDRRSVHCLYLMTPRKLANPLQFLVCEVRLFLVSGAFHLAQPRFFEMRSNSASDMPSRKDALACVKYFGT